jgi:hypothetical protein
MTRKLTQQKEEKNSREVQSARDMSATKHSIEYDLISYLLIAAVVLVNFVPSHANSDHCKARRFASNTSYMQFTKETVSQEYAVEGEFKNLHCCAKGYRSIEW